MNLNAALIKSFETFLRVDADAAVSIAVKVGDNETVTTTGLRSNKEINRSMAGNGMTETIDMAAWVKVSAFASVDGLRGKVAIVMHKGKSNTMRIMGTKEHALGGIVLLLFAELDRVA